ncbi:TetR family transcriptional regulator [beta proteobacterium AAP51]|nr:TetR family transcriptional regulator [beta proteobacterium AAP51]
MPQEPAPTRERLIAAMTDALQRRGLHGVGLAELLQVAQAPKGVLYHHFPGGKTELAVAAIDAVVAHIDASLQRLQQRPGTALDALRQWLTQAGQHLQRSGFERGCPLATVALESTPQDEAIRAAVARGFALLRERLAQVLVQAGVNAARAPGLAALVVSAYEGALMQARVAGDTQALRATVETLLAVVAQDIESPKP